MSKSGYKVAFMSEKLVSDIAARTRRIVGLDRASEFPIKTAINRCQIEPISKHGLLKIELFDAPDNVTPGVVTFNPLKLKIDREVWQYSDIGCPQSRWILAHEFGHIMLHDHYANEFSDNHESRIKFVQPEERSEDQADWFAYYILMPDPIVHRLQDARLIVQVCGVEMDIARFRLELFSRRWKGRYQE